MFFYFTHQKNNRINRDIKKIYIINRIHCFEKNKGYENFIQPENGFILYTYRPKFTIMVSNLKKLYIEAITRGFPTFGHESIHHRLN